MRERGRERESEIEREREKEVEYSQKRLNVGLACWEGNQIFGRDLKGSLDQIRKTKIISECGRCCMWQKGGNKGEDTNYGGE